MNALTHISPVIMVIDPDTLGTKEPKLIEYGVPVAFAASIYSWMDGLDRLQRNQVFMEMEDLIRLEMEEEKYRARRAKEAAAALQRAAAQALGRQTQEERNEAKRAEWRARILQAIREGHKTAHAVRSILNISPSSFDKHITVLREMGAVRVWQERNKYGVGRSHNVYEVAE
jgi:DNA-binding transcriptional ArsR family regulator